MTAPPGPRQDRERTFDVLVVGGGPAGAAAAIHCAQVGLRVGLIEAEPFPRDRPGETLHPGVEPLLRQLGVAEAVFAAGFPRHAGTWVEWGGKRQFDPFGPGDGGTWRGLQAWRAKFDALLLDAARARGVTVVQPCRAVGPLMAEGRVAGVITSRGPVGAMFVVDAAGGIHWLARRLRLPIERRSRRLIARYGYAEGSCPVRDAAPAIVADAAGWTWTARVGQGLYAWARLSWGDHGPRPTWPPAELRWLRPRGGVRGADVTWRITPDVAGAGYFLVGDAAAVLDPAASHGVLKAIMSGMLAAHTIAAVTSHGMAEAEGTAFYRRWVRDWFERDVATLKDLYSIFPHSSIIPGRRTT
jgi:flavin-dependent dehydrogenase